MSWTMLSMRHFVLSCVRGALSIGTGVLARNAAFRVTMLHDTPLACIRSLMFRKRESQTSTDARQRPGHLCAVLASLRETQPALVRQAFVSLSHPSRPCLFVLKDELFVHCDGSRVPGIFSPVVSGAQVCAGDSGACAFLCGDVSPAQHTPATGVQHPDCPGQGVQPLATARRRPRKEVASTSRSGADGGNTAYFRYCRDSNSWVASYRLQVCRSKGARWT